jgi:hypothetical protein
VIPDDDVFSVEVITLWNYPTPVSPVATAADAKAWIADHQKRAQSESEPSSPMQIQPVISAAIRLVPEPRRQCI